MRKLICLMAVCLLMAAMPLGVFAREDVQSMVDGLPAVEEFRAMDADAQLEAYHKTQGCAHTEKTGPQAEKYLFFHRDSPFEGWKLFSILPQREQNSKGLSCRFPAHKKDWTGIPSSGIIYRINPTIWEELL